MTPSPDEWVLVRNCLTLYEALVVRSALEGSDIECFLPDESLLGIRPELAVALGGARVLVRSDDLERATEALRDIEAAAGDDRGEE